MTICSFWKKEIIKIFGSLAAFATIMLEAACNWKLSTQDWDNLVMRAYHLERCYSMREGYVPARDDNLPDRFFEEIICNKYNEPRILDKEDFIKKRKERYLAYGLQEDGTPTADVLEKLGLGFTVDTITGKDKNPFLE